MVKEGRILHIVSGDRRFALNDRIIREIINSIIAEPSDRFAYLLQRTESYLVLDLITREFHEKFPSQPIFTIHDAVYTYEEYLPDLKQLLLKRFYEITGVRVGVKTTFEKSNPEPKPEDINLEWGKIKPISTQKNFDKVFSGVFIYNIYRGAEFLKILV